MKTALALLFLVLAPVSLVHAGGKNPCERELDPTQEEDPNAHLRDAADAVRARAERVKAEADALIELSHELGDLQTGFDVLVTRADAEFPEFTERSILQEAVARVLVARGVTDARAAETTLRQLGALQDWDRFAFTADVVETMLRSHDPDVDSHELKDLDARADRAGMKPEEYHLFVEKWKAQKESRFRAIEAFVMSRVRGANAAFIAGLTKLLTSKEVEAARLIGRQDSARGGQVFDTHALDRYLGDAEPAFIEYFVGRNLAHFTADQLELISGRFGRMLSARTAEALSRRLARSELDAIADKVVALAESGKRRVLDHGNRAFKNELEIMDFFDRVIAEADELANKSADSVLQAGLKLFAEYLVRERDHHQNQACLECRTSGGTYEMENLVRLASALRADQRLVAAGKAGFGTAPRGVAENVDDIIERNSKAREEVLAAVQETFLIKQAEGELIVFDYYRENIADARSARGLLKGDRRAMLFELFATIQEMEIHRHETGDYGTLSKKGAAVALKKSIDMMGLIQTVLTPEAK